MMAETKEAAKKLLFNKWDISEVRVTDPGLIRYVNLTALIIPHSCGKFSRQEFNKANMPIVERLISYGKKQNVAGLRLLLKHLPKVAAYKMYHEIAPKYATRAGGYTRIIKRARARKHDGSKMATIEFI